MRESDDSAVRLRLLDGKSIRPDPEKGRIGWEQASIDGSGHSAGWLVACAGVGGTQYAVFPDLVIYRAGEPVRHFGNGFML